MAFAQISLLARQYWCCREAMNRLREALEDYREAIVLEPKSKEAQNKVSSAEQKLAAGNGST